MSPSPTIKTAFGMITKDELRSIRGKAEKKRKPDAAIITSEELSDIKSRIIHKSPEQRIEEAHERERLMMTERQTSIDKKNMMKEKDAIRRERV